ncbi:hypothetical protein RFI_02246 [Reticulomyxa filosa]|uniref:Pentatricopeptide repeat-containing protein n=1 Tax=Reticulomyxa filosa TaxID=46433 RepID=X6P9J5_RETFI|nr:hypothetical protein RFI_02246 [Reticulomyxa filosa]|eukprot:ETO34841.1 hypothetical protein RFI_02246 [Reticulomyxa filosa]
MLATSITSFFKPIYSRSLVFRIAFVQQFCKHDSILQRPSSSRKQDSFYTRPQKCSRVLEAKQSGQDILIFLKNAHPSHKGLYHQAIDKCLDIKSYEVIPEIFQMAREQKIVFRMKLFDKVLTKLDLASREKIFDEWFMSKEEDLLLKPNVSIMNTMIEGYAKEGNVGQALNYFRLLISKYELTPDHNTCELMLLACSIAHDVESAELIWEAILHDPSIIIDAKLFHHILYVYSCSGNVPKVMNLLEYAQQHKIPISEHTCWIVAKGLLTHKKFEELIDFIDNKLPQLGLSKVEEKRIREKWKITGHLKMMEILDESDTETFAFHQGMVLQCFDSKYPSAKQNRIRISDSYMKYLMEFNILSNKNNWMNAVQDIERTLFYEPNYKHKFHFWDYLALPDEKVYLLFHVISDRATIFLLRYLMTFQRNELKEKFKDDAIKILCDTPFQGLIQNELAKWKVPIRLKIEQSVPNIISLDQTDVNLFFQTVPPGSDCLR